MFDEPLPKGSRLPESPRINTLLAGLMGTPTTSAARPAGETSSAPLSIAAQAFSRFLTAVQWNYVPTAPSMIAVTPGMSIREFFAQVNWSGQKNSPLASASGSGVPPSVESLMSQCSWD